MAVLEEGKLVELSIESFSIHRQIGNIYRGKWKMFFPGCKRLLSISVWKRTPFLYIDDLKPIGAERERE